MVRTRTGHFRRVASTVYLLATALLLVSTPIAAGGPPYCMGEYERSCDVATGGHCVYEGQCGNPNNNLCKCDWHPGNGGYFDCYYAQDDICECQAQQGCWAGGDCHMGDQVDCEVCQGGSWMDGICTGSPVLINLRSNSANYHLTSAQDGVAFDLNATGQAQQVAWTRSTRPVAFLTLDQNGNGTIDDGSELFGNATRLKNGQKARHGFEALVDLDGGPGLSDGVIDRDDSAYAQLRLWLDRNHNGQSEDGELVSLPAAGITAVFTHHSRERRRRDEWGNWYRFEGNVLMRVGEEEVARRMFDVWLAVQ